IMWLSEVNGWLAQVDCWLAQVEGLLRRTSGRTRTPPNRYVVMEASSRFHNLSSISYFNIFNGLHLRNVVDDACGKTAAAIREQEGWCSLVKYYRRVLKCMDICKDVSIECKKFGGKCVLLVLS
ncbi:hypothetical protein Hamer_G011362, partial [Homarus americanus]